MEFPILNNTEKLSSMLSAIKNNEVPSKFTYRFLESVGFPSSSDRGFVGVLKFLNLINSKGVPTTYYTSFRRDLDLLSLVKVSYADIFEAVAEPYKLSALDLKRIFMRHSTKDEQTAQGYAETFLALCRHSEVHDSNERSVIANKPPVNININLSVGSIEDIKSLLEYLK